jgi:hypothetical protein
MSQPGATREVYLVASDGVRRTQTVTAAVDDPFGKVVWMDNSGSLPLTRWAFPAKGPKAGYGSYDYFELSDRRAMLWEARARSVASIPALARIEDIDRELAKGTLG